MNEIYFFAFALLTSGLFLWAWTEETTPAIIAMLLADVVIIVGLVVNGGFF